MCDTSATFGSIETSHAQKRQYAYDSLAFNIEDPVFRELFPDLTEEIKRTLAERIAKASPTTANSDAANQSIVASSSSSSSSNSSSTSWLNSLLGNLMILALLALFAIVVRFILNSTAEIQ